MLPFPKVIGLMPLVFVCLMQSLLKTNPQGEEKGLDWGLVCVEEGCLSVGSKGDWKRTRLENLDGIGEGECEEALFFAKIKGSFRRFWCDK